MQISDYPGMFSASDTASLKAQRNFSLLFGTQLGMLVLASSFGVFATLAEPNLSKFLAVTIAILLAAGILLMWWLRARRFDKVWFDCRAVAESVKSATWRYMMQLPPFGLGLDAGELDKRFVGVVRAIRTDRPGVERHLAGLQAAGTEITEFMRRTRQLSLGEQKDLYLRCRLRDQQSWYERRAAENRSAGGRWLDGVFAIQIVALSVAVLRVLYAGVPVNFVPLLMTLASAMLAWTQARRHEELAEPYALAAQELRELGTLSYDVADQETFKSLVSDVEDAISREHMMWRAHRSMWLVSKNH